MDTAAARAEIKENIRRIEDVQGELEAIIHEEVAGDKADEQLRDIIDRLNECALDLANVEIDE